MRYLALDQSDGSSDLDKPNGGRISLTRDAECGPMERRMKADDGFGSYSLCFRVGPCGLHAGVGPPAALGHSQEGKSQTFELKMKEREERCRGG